MFGNISILLPFVRLGDTKRGLGLSPPPRRRDGDGYFHQNKKFLLPPGLCPGDSSTSFLGTRQSLQLCKNGFLSKSARPGKESIQQPDLSAPATPHGYFVIFSCGHFTVSQGEVDNFFFLSGLAQEESCEPFPIPSHYPVIDWFRYYSFLEMKIPARVVSRKSRKWFFFLARERNIRLTCEPIFAPGVVSFYFYFFFATVKPFQSVRKWVSGVAQTFFAFLLFSQMFLPQIFCVRV